MLGAGQPVDGVVDDGRDGRVVLRRHDEDAVRIGDLLAQRGGSSGDVRAVDVFVVERQVLEVLGDPQLDAFGRESGKRSEEHTSELQSLMRISYAVFCLQKK